MTFGRSENVSAIAEYVETLDILDRCKIKSVQRGCVQGES